MIRLNSNNAEHFKYKFKRDPKNWTIEDIHALYIKVSERYKNRRDKFIQLFDEISKTIEKGHRDMHYVYFTQVANGKEYLRQYEIRYDNTYESYCHSIGEVKLDTRESRLDFLLGNQKAFELGDKFKKLSNLSDGSHRTMWRVKEALWFMVEKQLQEKLKRADEIGEVFIIKISDKKYFVRRDKYSSSYYCKFEFLNEVKDDIVEIS